MYLKSIEIQGFKSFADKIHLVFTPGITSIVGPNGSGKSNIADAARWVLGEQSAKTLRGSKMEDVIFSGTEHRKPYGFAEVSLTIDNSDNTLPVPFNEITVTRRLFRSGESEYLINKVPCRLKDIHELFVDTGIGRDGYSIIGQGRVDEILSSRIEERRAVFEEASGIMKYKLRKEEAQRKLELTKQNLVRINDIIDTLSFQLEPLKEQAETARKYLALRENLKDLELNLYLINMDRYRERLKECDEQLQNVSGNIELEKKKLEDALRENARKGERLKFLEGRLSELNSEWGRIESFIEKAALELDLNTKRIAGLESDIARIESEMAEAQKRIEGLSQEEDSRKKRMEYLKEQQEKYLSKLEEAESRAGEMMKSLSQAEKEIELMKSSAMEKMDMLSDKKYQISSIKSHIESLEKRFNGIDQEVARLVLEKDRENMKREDIINELARTGEKLRKGRALLKELEEKKALLEKELGGKREKQNRIAEELHFKLSRQQTLKEMEKNLEGYNRSVRSVLLRCRQAPELGKGIHGALAQLLRVEKKYDTAVEIALGASLQDIVTDTEEDAKRAIEFLKKNSLGRATFLPISSVKGQRMKKELEARVQKAKGFCGIASDLVECDSRYREIVNSLLGRVVVAEDLDSGIDMAREFGYGFRIVTLEGDVLNTTGAITGGSAAKRPEGGSIFSRNREIEELKGEIDSLTAQEASVKKEIDRLLAELEGLDAAIGEEEKLLREAELAKVSCEGELTKSDEALERIAARIDMLKQEKEQLAKQIDQTKVELGKYEKEREDIERDIEETRGIIERQREKHSEKRGEMDSLHEEITDLKISVNSIRESMDSINETLARIGEEKSLTRKNLGRRLSEKEKCLERIKALKAANEGLEKEIENRKKDKVGKTFEIDRVTEEKKVLEEEMAAVSSGIESINNTLELYRSEHNRIEVRKVKLESEMEAIQNRMWDEYEMTYSLAETCRKDIGPLSQAQRKAAEIREEIKSLGTVNVSAIDDYVRTRERLDFMVSQREDVGKSIEKLRGLINELTSVMKQQFLEQFELINRNFGQVFAELFDGGKARIMLSDEENVLESGIEIEVQPPGKKLQNMMLLSGGEKALTAIALLFAILRLRPTPFCILDEIEATLDDANSYRFAEFIRSYSKKTQFILVTHKKSTMEVSDNLYGVTMQEYGVSNIFSLKVGEMAG